MEPQKDGGGSRLRTSQRRRRTYPTPTTADKRQGRDCKAVSHERARPSHTTCLSMVDLPWSAAWCWPQSVCSHNTLGALSEQEKLAGDRGGVGGQRVLQPNRDSTWSGTSSFSLCCSLTLIFCCWLVVVSGLVMPRGPSLAGPGSVRPPPSLAPSMCRPAALAVGHAVV